MGAEWQSSCYLRAWYDGQIQAARDGADFRVYLPAAWEGDVSVTTEDNVQESETYPDRGDVIVKGARGNVEIEVENGTVTVEMADDMREVLNCDAAGIQACLDEGWPATCGCTDFSRIAVDSGPGLSANISVDIPGHIWSTARLKNAQAGLTPSSDPLCEALVDCDGFNDCDIFTADPNKPFEREVEFNDPGDLAVEGAGVSVNLTSNGCGIIPSVTGPEDFETGIAETKRGDVSICTGCLDIPVP